MAETDADAAEARAEIIAALGRFQGHSSGEYVGRGTWYLALRQLSAARVCPRLIRPAIPGLGPKVYWGLIANRMRLSKVTLPVDNTALQVAESGTRVRAFEANVGVSRKLIKRDSKYGCGVGTDLAVRNGPLSQANVRYPVVYRTQEVSGYVFIEEALVYGRRFHPIIDARLTRDHLVEPLSRLYVTVGVRTVPLTEALGAATVKRLLSLETDRTFLRRAQALIYENSDITVAFGHGDLLPSNLAVDRSGVVFLDWETAGYTPVGFDLLRLWRKYPRVKALASGAATLIRRHQSRPLGLYDTACLQLAVGLLGARTVPRSDILEKLPTDA